MAPSSGAGIATSIACGSIAGEVAAGHAIEEEETYRRTRGFGGGDLKFEAGLEIKRLPESIDPEEVEAIKEAFRGLGT